MNDIIKNEDLLALVKSKIYTIRGQKVMLDFDLAAMYVVETRLWLNFMTKTLNFMLFYANYLFIQKLFVNLQPRTKR